MAQILTFPYISRPFKDPQTNKEGEIFSPIVPIKISCKRQIFGAKIDTLIDSGCDNSLFPGFFLTECMKIDITKNAKKCLQVGISGHPIETYRHQVKIFLNGMPFSTHVEFSEDYHSIPLLGRNCFFKLFKEVSFNEKEKKLLLKLN
jgi:hypothetical protein